MKIRDDALIAGVAAFAGVATFQGAAHAAGEGGAVSPINLLYPVMLDGLAVLAFRKSRVLDGWRRVVAWAVVLSAAGASGTAQAYVHAADRDGAAAVLAAGIGAAPAVAVLLATILGSLRTREQLDQLAAPAPAGAGAETTEETVPAPPPAPAADDVPAPVPAPAPVPVPAPAEPVVPAPVPAPVPVPVAVEVPEPAPVPVPAPVAEPVPAPRPAPVPAPPAEEVPPPAPTHRPARRKAPARVPARSSSSTRETTSRRAANVPQSVRDAWADALKAGHRPSGAELAAVAGVGQTRGKHYRRTLELETAGGVTAIPRTGTGG